MARGFPDFFGVPIFPMYGGARLNLSNIVVDPTAITQLVEIQGKGHIYHIELASAGFITIPDDGFILYIDNVNYFGNTFRGMRDYGVRTATLGAPYLSRYDRHAMRYCIWFTGIITFTQNVILQYNETSGNTPTASQRIRYSLIV